MMTSFAELRRDAGVSLAEIVSGFGGTNDNAVAWENGSKEPPVHVVRALQFLSLADKPSLAPSRLNLPNNSSTDLPEQTTFSWLPATERKAPSKELRTGAFVDNMRLPVHRWFRYSAGFSASWVSQVIEERGRAASQDLLFDPFAGSGTSLLSARSAGVASAGAERHPFVHRIAQTKLNLDVDPSALRAGANDLLQKAQTLRTPVGAPPNLLQKCYSTDALERLERLRLAFVELPTSGDAVSSLLWLAITSILRECSAVGTAQWQYVLPNKLKARVSDPYSAFERRIEMFCADIGTAGRITPAPQAQSEILQEDARSLEGFSHLRGRVSLVITSPPYPNNYDYADATRLEMTFWREVASWGDLQKSVRHRLVRSCSQHSAAEHLTLGQLLADPAVETIRDELSAVCNELAEVRETKAGRKTYHTMIAAYFVDLAKVWQALRPLCADGADVCFVIGDSAPYGVYVPVDRWLSDLAVGAGFKDPKFEKIRDRNLKWKNRKHTVPLKEGNLWLQG